MPHVAWWEAGDALERFAGDLIAAEIAALRPGRRLPPPPWPPSTRLDESGLGADSLDRLKIATALGEAIHLHRGPTGETLLARETFGEWVAAARRSLAAFSDEVTFRTSGTTGHPKWCVHALEALEAEIDVAATWFPGTARVLGAVPAHHIYGFLFTILLPARLGIPVVDVRLTDPGAFAALIRPGDLVVGHPAFWSVFARGVPAVAHGARGVTSTAPCPPDVARAVVGTGLDELVEVYGSSETAGIARRADPAAPYELLPYWRRGDGDDELVRTMPDGGERRFALPDAAAWVDARRLRPAGRREGAVQVGGHNVFPPAVAAALKRHPGVADAAVRLMLPSEGDRLKAFVVPRDPGADVAALRDDLERWIDARLPVPERPRAIAFGPALPSGALGKPADWPLESG